MKRANRTPAANRPAPLSQEGGGQAVEAQQVRQQRHHGADREAPERGHRGRERAGQLVRDDAELLLRVHPQRLLRVRLQHVGHLACERLGQPSGGPHADQLVGLALRVDPQLVPLLVQLRRDLVVLGADAGVLADAHRDRARHQA
nr:hypothetical protein GCM10020092_018550 [Actinoplanes digitatis]